MSGTGHTLVVDELDVTDVVAVAQCIVIDADSFPYPSARFAPPAAFAHVWTARGGGDGRPPLRAQTWGPVLGFLAAHLQGEALKIDGLAVDRQARRAGIGRALARRALAHAQDRGLRAAILHVSVANAAALALYRTEGFTVSRRLVGFYPAAAFGGQSDAYEMVLRLSTAD